MSIRKFLQWQWSGYSTAHQNRTNLLFHIVAVPLFMSATLLAVYALVGLSLPADGIKGDVEKSKKANMMWLGMKRS